MKAAAACAAAREIPPTVGIGLRPQHYADILAGGHALGWVEVHSENYFGDGGQPLRCLERIRADWPLSLHGVGLSLGRADALDREHLRLLRRLIERFEPGLVSEHLCWGAVPAGHLNDLLPLPYTEEALALMCRHVDEAQDFLGQPLLIENVSSYLSFADSSIPEWEFIAELARRSGCGLLLDVNNIYVSASNHGFDASRYLHAVPAASVREMHLAGFEVSEGLLIDTHGRRVDAAVWGLYAEAVARFPGVPTLIEWDTDIPPLTVLLEEAAYARSIMEARHDRAA